LTLPLLALSVPALGQAFNIDCGNLGTPPDSGYGAGAHQQGYWNAAGSSATLRDLNGNLTTAQLGVDSGSGFHDIPGANGDDETLMETTFDMIPSSVLTLSNLAPGKYDLYAYSWGGQIFGSRTVGFTIRNGPTTYGGSLSFGPNWPGGQIEGETFARIPVEVLASRNSLTLSIGGGGPKTFNVLAGIQLVLIPAPSAASLLLGISLLAIRRSRRS
jgi:hypothetical protein